MIQRLSIILLFSCLFFSKNFAQNDSITRGVYLNIATDSSITILWRTKDSCNSEVRIGTSFGNLTQVFQDTNQVINHSLRITGLLPQTYYYYSVGTSDTVLQEGPDYHFVTAPPVGSNPNALRFWVTGDFGTGSPYQDSVTVAFDTYTDTTIVNGWLWLGDNAYNLGTDIEYQYNTFNHYRWQMRKYPLFPALGNHDYAQSGYLSALALGTNFPYFDIFDIQANSNTEKYYSYDYGNIHFVAIDSYGAYNTPGSPMYTWLENDLNQNHQKWTIAYFHHSPYTMGSHNSDTEIELIDMRTNIVPLLERKGVDLVLNGHSHIYERSFFMKGHYGIENSFSSLPYPLGNIVQPPSNTYYKTSPKGTIYVVCGVSGKVGGAMAASFPHAAMQTSIASGNGSLVLDISDDTLHCKYLTSHGIIADEFKIAKHKIMGANPIREIQAFFDNGQILLKWATDNPAPNTIFEVERSVGNEKFVKIGSISTQENEENYEFRDPHPLNGLSFYRLKLLDSDSLLYYISDAAPYMWQSLNDSNSISILQNPAFDRLLFYAHDAGEIEITDLQGKKLLQQNVFVGAQQAHIQHLASGLYWLTFFNKGKKQSIKFVKI